MKSASVPRLYAAALLIFSLVVPTHAAQKPSSATTAPQKPRPVATASPSPTSPAAKVSAQKPKPTAPSPTPRPKPEEESSEVDRTLDDVVGAEDYALYFEVRSLGQLARSKEVVELIEAFRTLGVVAPEVEDYSAFFTANAELLSDVKSATLMLPTRPGLPTFISAQEFPNAETARAMEPKLRAEGDKLVRVLADEPPVAPVKSSGEKTTEPKSPTASLIMKRFGRLILMSNEPFTLKALRPKDSPSLAENARFQTLRGRLSSEPLFLYIDIALMRRGIDVQREKWEKEHAPEQTTSVATIGPKPAEVEVYAPPEMEGAGEGEGEREGEGASEGTVEGSAESAIMIDPVVVAPSPDEREATPPPPVPTSDGSGGTEVSVSVGSDTARLEATSEPRAAGVLRSLVFNDFLFGAPKWPEAIGAGLAVRDDSFVVRALLVNQAGEFVVPVPFISGLISGPHITPQAAALAPADTDIFVSASLDLKQIFLRLLGAATDSFKQMETEREAARGRGRLHGADESAQEDKSDKTDRPQELTPEAALAAAELLVGFKIKDDFIPAFGNEVGLSLPSEWFTSSGPVYNAGRGAKSKDEGKSPVAFIALNNAEAVQKMLPRVLELIGLKSAAAADQSTSHAGVKINVYGPLAMAYVNNFLVVSSDAASIMRALDAGSSSGALAFDARYRDETDWEPKQNLASVYVSQRVFDQILSELTRWLDPKDPEVERVLTRLRIRTRAASYVVTDEGGGVLLHELRLPTAVLKLIIAEEALQPKAGPMRGAESSALSTLSFIRETEDTYKKSKGAYGTLDELVPKPRADAPRVPDFHPLARKNLDAASYRIELLAVGDKYSVSATPKDYGKAGRRSFYMDETGIIRAADRAGQPATADDPPID